MKPFDYAEPRSVEEAVALLAERRGETRLLAGGTDLLVRLEDGRWRADRVVNLKRIEALRALRIDAGGIEIGALVTVAEVARAAQERVPVLAQAALSMGSPQVRNLATVVGNLANASPAADMAPPLLCLDAGVRIAGPAGERSVPLEQFFVGPGRTALAPDEVVTAIVAPAPPAGLRATYLKWTVREALDVAIAGVAVASAPGDLRIALGAVAPTPLRARRAERAGDPAEEAARECSPVDDVRASAWYRRRIVRVLVRRALVEVGR